MSARPKFLSVNDYMASVDRKPRSILQEIRRLAKEAVPEAVACISYQMPALKLQRVFFYYAAFKKHIGVYPPVKGDSAIAEELLPYRGEKGNLQFPIDKPIPYSLITRVAETLAREYSE